jgi:hypothetical protein
MDKQLTEVATEDEELLGRAEDVMSLGEGGRAAADDDVLAGRSALTEGAAV